MPVAVSMSFVDIGIADYQAASPVETSDAFESWMVRLLAADFVWHISHIPFNINKFSAYYFV
jgi:hypothetical protein